MRTKAMFTPRVRTLGASLREVRLGAHFGVRELARRIGVNPSLVAHWEFGSRVPTPEDVSAVLGALGVVGDEKMRILNLARGSAEEGWIAYGRPGTPNQLTCLVACEHAAKAMAEWSPLGIPGLLQTADYARALLESTGLAAAEVERRIAVRMERRNLILGSDPLPFEALIGEAALRDTLGTPATMAGQLRALASLSERPTITVRVVPSGIGWHPGLAGRFILYTIRDSRPVVYFEHLSSGAFVADDYDVRQYRAAIEGIRKVALSAADSTALATRLAEEIEERAGDRSGVAQE
ncbi:helix-turn-helix transcriptional regulator [Amycolatopsis rhabdoformis]|uniref:Helix-turn-helix transcriptional regulator n=1 Tax=Amycolatopsis rhabdoformis TaxID=1448059 RepID=A0ABZ1I397_9PSEU|nr:helix-turn-helix transcriptional regulator [Amycolatopsis rhabdoformis]WSE28135.1 helix-turn-helix transcriptional regulator [Amycolatopsis rhabdoformis]